MDIRKEYISWMWETVNISELHDEYYEVFLILHKIPFRYIVAMDSNRHSYGIELRHRFIFEENLRPELQDKLDGECSMLEMLIAMVLAGVDMFNDDMDYDEEVEYVFWSIIENMGLMEFPDDILDEDSRLKVKDIVQNVMDRNYSPDGKGGLFYIRNPNEDLRNVEFWKQLCWWFTERMKNMC